MKADKAVQCTGTENDKKLNFEIGVNRNIILQYNPNTKKIRFETKTEDLKLNTRRCLNLALNSWSLFCSNLPAIEKAVAEVEQGQPEIDCRVHIGSLFFVTVKSEFNCVDIRKWYISKQDTPSLANLRPGIPGITLKFCEFENLVQDLEVFHWSAGIELPEACALNHENQEAAVQCSFCNPWGLFY